MTKTLTAHASCQVTCG